MKNKALHIILIAVVSIALFYASQYAWLKVQYFKSLETEIETLKNQISDFETQEAETINTARTNTKKASKQKQAINDKLKQDEKIIDASDVSDDDIRDVLSKYH